MDVVASWARLRQDLGRVRYHGRRIALRMRPVEKRSDVVNAFHCCVQRTGSQWLRQLLSDPDVYRRSGLLPYLPQIEQSPGVDPSVYHHKRFTSGFPPHTVATPLYIDHSGYRSILKPEKHAAVFVQRDPRDIVVSAYFSLLHSHGLNPTVLEERRLLEQCSTQEGLVHTTQRFERIGLFAALSSWADAAPEDDSVLLVRFEEMIDSRHNLEVVRRIFDHFDIEMESPQIGSLLDRYSFESMSGRPQGEENLRSHYRRGVAGDWQDHFDEVVTAAFADATGDLVTKLGYR